MGLRLFDTKVDRRITLELGEFHLILVIHLPHHSVQTILNKYPGVHQNDIHLLLLKKLLLLLLAYLLLTHISFLMSLRHSVTYDCSRHRCHHHFLKARQSLPSAR